MSSFRIIVLSKSDIENMQSLNMDTTNPKVLAAYAAEKRSMAAAEKGGR